MQRPPLETIESIISDFSNRTLLIIGDLIIDEYLWGKVERISPEAPVQVVDIENQSYTLGGAGNVINNLVSLGAKIHAVGVVGMDENGRLLQDELQRLNVETGGILSDGSRRTSKKTRVVGGGQQILRIDWETRRDIHKNLEDMVIHYARDYIPVCDAVLISDYAKGVLTTRVLNEVISNCNTHQKPVLVDPKGKDFGKYRGATIITANKKEAAMAAGTDINSEDELVQVGRKMLRDLKLRAALITRGKEGMSLFVKDESPLHIPAQVKEVYDVSGAGDTVLAVLGLGIACGCSYADASYLANMAAGFVVGKIGTATITQDELMEVVAKRISPAQFKIKGLRELTHIVGHLKAQGKKIVFTNGCFDILHTGHISLLKESKVLGDILIVALDSDDSVRKIKGKGRPIISQNERIQIIASLDCVDYVIVFSTDSLCDLLRELNPHILTKGSNYERGEVMGREIVEAYGGEVKLIPVIKGISTSEIIGNIISRCWEKR